MQWGILYETERNNSEYALKVNIAFLWPDKRILGDNYLTSFGTSSPIFTETGG